jgi:drug/metabolite transporter (DMT)-like permease
VAAPGSAAHRSRVIGYIAYITAATLFAINGTNLKALLDTGISPERLVQVRITGAFLILLIAVAITRPRALRLRRAEIPWILAYGAAGVSLTQYLYFIALQVLPVGVALVLEFTAPFMVALWVRFAMHQKVNGRVWFGMLVAVPGLVLVAQVWNGFSVNFLGLLAALGAAAALALYYLVGERLQTRPEPRDSMSLTMWAMAAAALFWALVQPVWSFPWQDLTGKGFPFGTEGLAVPVVVLVAWMILLGTVVPFFLATTALRFISAAQMSTIGMVEPLIASAVAWVALGQVLAPAQIIGGVIVLAGVYIAEKSR